MSGGLWLGPAPTGGEVEGFDLTTKGDLHGYDTDQARVPVGTNDNYLISDSADAQGVRWASRSMFRAERITSIQAIGNSSGVGVIYNSIIREDDADARFAYSTSTGVMTVNTAGWYQISAGVLWEASTTGKRILSIFVDSGGTAATEMFEPDNAAFRQNVSTIIYINAAEEVFIEAFQTSGGDLDVQVDSTSFFAMAQLS